MIERGDGSYRQGTFVKAHHWRKPVLSHGRPWRTRPESAHSREGSGGFQDPIHFLWGTDPRDAWGVGWLE